MKCSKCGCWSDPAGPRRDYDVLGTSCKRFWCLECERTWVTYESSEPARQDNRRPRSAE